MTTQISAIQLFRSYRSATLEGTITFNNSHGEMKINVSPDKIARIVAAIAEEIVATAQTTANLMVQEVLEDAAQAETPKLAQEI